MSTAPYSPEDLALNNDRIWSGTGAIGYVILLSGALYTGTWAVNTSTDVLTTAAAHGLVTGSRARLTTTGALPGLSSGSLNSSTDYYAIVTSSTTLQLATTLANAQASTAINFADTGSGTHTLSEQRLNRETAKDPLSVLINKELTHASYARQAVTGVGAAIAVGSYGEKNPFSFTFSTSGSPMIFRHVLFIRGGSSTLGDTTGTEPALTTESADVTITSGAPRIVTYVLRTRNVA